MTNFLPLMNAAGDASGIESSKVWTIDKEIIAFFNNLFGNNGWGNFLLVLISLLLTVFLVGLIGFEREYQGHNAGLRTHVLVALGSCVIMIISIYSIGYKIDGNMETMRLAATVCTGIGFLGAGVIIQTGTTVKGLTTAATLWMSMSIGLACGSGNFTIAVLGTILALLCLICFVPLEKFAAKKNPIIYLLLPIDSSPIKDVLNISGKHNINIRNFETFICTYEGKEAIRLIIKLSRLSKEELEAFRKDLSENLETYEVKVA